MWWIGFVVVGVFVVFFGICFFMRRTSARQNDKFASWLIENNFDKSEVIGGKNEYGVSHVGGFAFDVTHKKWCKVGVYKIYSFSDLEEARVAKTSMKESTRSGGKVVSKDISTYEVKLRITDIANALITIPCGSDRASADKLRATVENIIAGEKAYKKKASH